MRLFGQDEKSVSASFQKKPASIVVLLGKRPASIDPFLQGVVGKINVSRARVNIYCRAGHGQAPLRLQHSSTAGRNV